MSADIDKELDMQTRRFVASLTSLALIASSSLAFAAPDDHDRGHEQRGNAYGHAGNRPDARRVESHDGPGAGPDHAFYRGGRLPNEYRSRQYVVDDWRGHHLSAPPRGYHWVQTGGDYVLAAIATGVIASILLNH
jgi:Ni/Co efflux regulator RcnB